MSAGSLETREKLLYGDGTLVRAVLAYESSSSGAEVKIPVQFNPTEYSISRSVRFKDTTGNGEEPHPKNLQSKRGSLATLKVSLILDTTSYISGANIPVERGLNKYLNDEEELSLICRELSLLMKTNSSLHTQSLVTFSWGSMEFWGHLTSLNISYQMFNRNGQPVRAKLELSIEGEEKKILTKIGANPRESPDRTKYRRLNQKEELWMLADAEYHDVSCWKEIARENGILNPRKIDYTRRLKVPAL